MTRAKSASPKARSKSVSSFSAIVSQLTLVTLVLSFTASWLAQHHPTPATTKQRFTTFEHFYPFYLTEHSNQTNRYLHFVGTTLYLLAMLYDARMLLVGPVALVVGLNVFYLTLDVPHGFIEFGAMILTFLIVGRMATGTWAKPMGAMTVGYFWAWVGHFFIEKNKPATFTFATFSFLGDIRMWVDTLVHIKDSIATWHSS